MLSSLLNTDKNLLQGIIIIEKAHFDSFLYSAVCKNLICYISIMQKSSVYVGSNTNSCIYIQCLKIMSFLYSNTLSSSTFSIHLYCLVKAKFLTSISILLQRSPTTFLLWFLSTYQWLPISFPVLSIDKVITFATTNIIL